jgi:FkbM family methyltransferase
MDRRSFIGGAFVGLPAGALLARLARKPSEPAAPAAWVPPPEGRLSYAQQGEDIVLFHVLRDLLKVNAPTYIDIGAADPVLGSNTYLMYCTGGHGVLVEPNPTYVEKLKARRPKDVVVAAGVGVGDAREADYYVIRGQPPLNTFSPKVIETLKPQFGPDLVERVVKMPLVPVNELIRTHLGQAPDLLSIDVEGLDLDILRTLDFEGLRPGAIVAETVQFGAPGVNDDLYRFVVGKGYVVRGGSCINTVFVDRRRIQG